MAETALAPKLTVRCGSKVSYTIFACGRGFSIKAATEVLVGLSKISALGAWLGYWRKA